MRKKEPAGERVRKASSDHQNAVIDNIILKNIKEHAGKSPTEISHRIESLDKEWDIERVLDLNMSVLALCGITSTLVFNKYSIVLTILLLLFFIWHAFQGWCPPIPILRFFKVRTRAEIDREKYALKAMRGDFNGLANTREAATWAFEAARKI